MRKNISLFFLFISVLISAQKKVTIAVCIDGESRLHIKNGKLFWEHKTFWEPGTHESCTTKTTVNDKVWETWSVPFTLNFSTNNQTVETKIIIKNEISKLIQVPSAKEEKEEKKDIEREVNPVSTPAPKKIDPPLNYTIAFKVNEDVLSKTMTNLFDSLLKTRAIYRISGFKTSGTLQLYEKRAQAVGTYLLSNGAKSVQYIGFGENKPLATKADTIDIIITDN